MRLHRGNPSRVGFERGVQRFDVRARERRGSDLGRHVILPPACRPIRVRHVPRGLLEVRHQASPLEHLGDDVGDAFAGDVRTAELRDRVVAIFIQNARIQLLGARGANARIRDVSRRPGRVHLADELVEKQPPDRFRRTRVARKERALHRLGKIPQREDRSIRIREVGFERVGFFRRERFGDGGEWSHGGRVFYLA